MECRPIGCLLSALLLANADGVIAEPVTQAVGIAASSGHTCVVRSDGSARCWGANGWGQLGVDRRSSANKAVSPRLSGPISAIATGGFSTCAVLSETGAVQCWGRNTHGQLGDGGTTWSSLPVDVVGIGERVLAVSVGEVHACALGSGGQVYCWGDNAYGQLGNGTTTSSLTAVAVPGLADATQISVGSENSCAVRNGGAAVCWGLNRVGTLVDANDFEVLVPTQVVGLSSGVEWISSGSQQTCAVVDAGVRCWGNHVSISSRFLHVGSTELTPIPVQNLIGEASRVFVGWKHVCALMTDGLAQCWGSNYFGQRGHGHVRPIDGPTIAAGSQRFDALAVGDDHTCGIRSGEVYCWGVNRHGEIGDGTSHRHRRLRPVPTLDFATDVQAISAGTDHSCLLTAEREARCWGNNELGQLGDGSTEPRRMPVPVVGLGAGLRAVVAGNGWSCAVTAGGAVKCWGDNKFGMLGDGTLSSRNVPVDVLGLSSGFVSLALGSMHTCALADTGKLFCWGGGGERLGLGSGGYRTEPIEMIAVDFPVAEVAAGRGYTCVTSHEGLLRCWGDNDFNVLGRADVSETPVPGAVNGIDEPIKSIAAGERHTCAVTFNGRALCWGDARMIGDGTDMARSQATEVLGLVDVDAIAIGGVRTCAWTSAGAVSCWGRNSSYGEVGNGAVLSTVLSPVPLAISPPTRRVSTGYRHACALSDAGTLHCWGTNEHGSIGDGTWGMRPSPQRVMVADESVVFRDGIEFVP